MKQITVKSLAVDDLVDGVLAVVVNRPMTGSDGVTVNHELVLRGPDGAPKRTVVRANKKVSVGTLPTPKASDTVVK